MRDFFSLLESINIGLSSNGKGHDECDGFRLTLFQCNGASGLEAKHHAWCSFGWAGLAQKLMQWTPDRNVPGSKPQHHQFATAAVVLNFHGSDVKKIIIVIIIIKISHLINNVICSGYM